MITPFSTPNQNQFRPIAANLAPDWLEKAISNP
jgi:hypothetical protein